MPWAMDAKNRLNPMNGLAMNALHDRAFEVGLITISATDYTIRISSELKVKDAPACIVDNFHLFEGKPIRLPKKFKPDTAFLEIHNQTRFRG
jgi:putative restriction endonuclease